MLKRYGRPVCLGGHRKDFMGCIAVRFGVTSGDRVAGQMLAGSWLRYRGLTNSLIAKRFLSSGSDCINCLVAVSARLIHVSVSNAVISLSGA